MFKNKRLISGEMGSVNLGGEENATSLVVHFLDSSIQVFRSIFTDAAISLFCCDNSGECGQGERLPFCKHSNQPGHLCNQPVGRDQHTEEGEDWDPLPDRL